MKTIKYKFLSLVITLIITFFLRNEFTINNGIEVDLFLKQSKDIELQIFYADEINKEFSEENSVKISSLKTEKIKKYLLISILKNLKK